uniref:BRO-B n=1 Tax=Chrysodeixis includens nucleopolyhedrovirus TaxID=1207438 RepID=A0A1C8ZZD0_9ABAC|nr:BRO-B [Chrysodeixis includens nucleopolyhedrovirus]
MTTSKIVTCFGNKNLEVVCVVDDNGERWMLANPFARILEYSNAPKAISTYVSDNNQSCLDKIQSAQDGKTCVTSSYVQAKSKFINKAGLFELIQNSKMPKALEFRNWINSDLLPKLCNEGKYDMQSDAPKDIQEGMEIIHQVTNEGESAIWMKENNMKLKMEVMEKNLIIDRKNNTIYEMKINYERQIAEYKEKALKMQLDLNKMSHMAHMNMMQLGITTLLAEDNIKENKQMRNSLESVSDRVVPSLANRPEKEEYVTGYERTVDGKKRIRMSRCQRVEIDQCDRFLERQRSNPSKNKRSKRYEWLIDSEKFLQIKCANPVAVWVVIRAKYPHMFYGLKYVNKLCTEMEILNEDELRQKYLADVEMVEKNRLVDRTAIEHFKSLELTSEEDAILKCLTPSIEAKERVAKIVHDAINDIKGETKPEGDLKTYENASEFYSPQKVHDQCIKNYYSVNNNFFNNTMPLQDSSVLVLAIDDGNTFKNHE